MEEYLNKDIDPKFFYETESARILIPITVLIVDDQISTLKSLRRCLSLSMMSKLREL